MKKLNLIIDDDEINNTFCRFIISKAGIEGHFQSFTDPEEGLKFVADILINKHYDKVVLFLDINMPIMTGWDFLKEFEKIYSYQTEIKIYILSSSISEDDKSHAQANKYVKDFISKPLSIGTLGKIRQELAA